MVPPTIPGLNDSAILETAREAGVLKGGYILLRLPLTVEPVFRQWLQQKRPREAQRVWGRIRETRGGKLSSSTWGEPVTGNGEIAEQIVVSV